ncbi:phosphatase PAP2 family protein [Paenibacillus alkalitolerans]|uniref:hypothetical protein n=1 Tax=Paenibacillus alkalitolerans TaxID=2799335 RepID=UPI0018F3F14D|nr:hypothetical protein [Paenibacillus alkalitolerans]
MGDINDGEKMSGALPSEEKWLWLAQSISRFSNPLYIAPPFYLVVALATAPDFILGLLWWALIGAGVSAIPFLVVRRGVRRGHYSDHHVSKREQRLIPFLIAVGCMGIVLAISVLLKVSNELIGTMAAMTIACVLALVITHAARWKISLHLIGISGAVTSLALLFDPYFLLLFPLIVLVGWSRWMVNAHTPLQICAGSLLGIGVTAVVYMLFGLL